MKFDNRLDSGREIFRESRDAMFLYDPLSRAILGANPAATALAGVGLEELRSMTIGDLFPMESAEDPLLFSIPREGTIMLRETARLVSERNGETAVALKLTRLGTRAEPIGLLTVWPVAERREPPAVMERFFRICPGLFCVVDGNATILKLNPVWEEKLGYSVADLEGRSFYELVHPEDIGRTTEACRVLDRVGELCGFENRLRHRDGRVVRLSWNASSEGGLIYAVARDVTEERERRDELVRAKEVAEAADRDKSQFLANVSHEIRTPMTAILALTDVLMNDPYFREAPPESLENLLAVKNSGRHLLGVLDDILDLSRIEIGKHGVGMETYSPIDLVEETIALMKIRAEAKGLPLIAEYSAACPSLIRTDPTRLRQVLINLVSNSIKYSDRGEIRIKVSPVESPGHGCSALRFEVADTGIGIPHEMRARIFEPFERARPTEKATAAGTGLGLSISRRLMELLGGTIEARSIPGKGSTFTITLALNPGQSSAPSIDRSATPPAGARETSALPTDVLDARILLAEDSPTNQKAIGMCLRIAGAGVVVVSNGADAVETALGADAAGEPFDVVLMDMQMPVLDGYEATRQLRRRGYSGPIIALTAYALDESDDECLRIGCDALVGKPVDWNRLVRLIRDLSGRESPRAVPPPRRSPISSLGHYA